VGGARFWNEWEPNYNSGTVNALRERIERGDLPDITTYEQFSQAS